MKKVLAIYYSQSGQLEQIIDNFCAPFTEAGADVEKVRVRLKNDFCFSVDNRTLLQCNA